MQAIELSLEERSGSAEIGCIDLFYLLGTFKKGLTYETLKKIWPNDQLDENLHLFEKFGLLESYQTRRTLNQNATQFVQCSHKCVNTTLMDLLI